MNDTLGFFFFVSFCFLLLLLLFFFIFIQLKSNLNSLIAPTGAQSFTNDSSLSVVSSHGTLVKVSGHSEAYSEPCQTSETELLAKITAFS